MTVKKDKKRGLSIFFFFSETWVLLHHQPNDVSLAVTGCRTFVTLPHSHKLFSRYLRLSAAFVRKFDKLTLSVYFYRKLFQHNLDMISIF